MSSIGLFLLITLLIFIFWGIKIYNNLIRLRNQVKNAWSQIDVQLQRRYDLIPNLVETVKGYMKHERGTLEAVIEARNIGMKAREELKKEVVPKGEAMQKLIGAETMLKGALGNIFALAENYPDLKANTTMIELQEELRTTENKVAFSRQSYNEQVMQYNITQEQFPAMLVARTFGHTQAELFEIEEKEAKKAVKVSFE